MVSYGSPYGSTWCPNGFLWPSMVFPMPSLSLHMVLLWFSSGVPIVFICHPYDSPYGFPTVSYGGRVVGRLLPMVPLMVPLWFSEGTLWWTEED